MSDDEPESPEWQRLELVAGARRFVELTAVGRTVYVREGERDGPVSVEIHQLGSPAAAARSLARRIRAVEDRGYSLAAPVRRPLPSRDSRAESAELLCAGRTRFDAELLGFVREWRALGYEPTQSFVESVRGSRTHPAEVAEACMALARRIYGVEFTRKTRTFDDEHGSKMSVPRGLRVSFYQSPAHVLAIALRKLQGRSRKTDDVVGPGLEDEVQAQLERLCRSG